MIVAQQARDAASIIKAMGFEKAVVVGRSGGAIIALELAGARPEVIDFMIVHEPPVIELLSDSEAQRWRTFVDKIYMKSQREGWQAAQAEFIKSLINVPDTPYPADLSQRLSSNVDFFFKHELRAFSGYLPNIQSIRNNNLHMVTAVGRENDTTSRRLWLQRLGLAAKTWSFWAIMMCHFGCLKNSLAPSGRHC
jgi:pimeloyl-ACP methyl ester carboxylesterase